MAARARRRPGRFEARERSWSVRFRVMRWTLVAASFAVLTTAGVAGAQDEAWKKDAAWATVRVGAVKSLEQNAPGGNIGWGFGYRRMLTPRLSMGAAFDHDLLGRF